jgi:hypothetical protein
MANIWGKNYTRLELLRRIGDLRQVAGVTPFELTDGPEQGVRAVRMYNAAGLDFTVLPDRGLGIVHLGYQGAQLSYLSGVGMVHPAFTYPFGLGWLRTWPVGFLTTCGLTYVGSPGSDNGEEQGLHGRVGSLPAGNVHWGETWQGDDCTLWLEGTLRETAVFGDNIRFTRRFSISIGGSSLRIDDRIENLGFSPAPHMFLQHFNLGFPLVDASTRLELGACTTVPRDERAIQGLGQCCEFSAPQAGYNEQVFYHDLEQDSQGRVEVRLVNPAFDSQGGLGISWRYAKQDYPILVEWKMMGEGMYVVGVEPANCHVSGRAWEREHGDLQILQPQEVRTYSLEIGIFRTF